MEFIKGRSICPGQRISCYVNLNQQSRFSLVDMEPKSPTKGLVIGYAESVLIHSAQFKVSEAGRQKVLSTKRKLVHSSVVGTLISVDQPKPQELDSVVNYFPYVRGDYHTETGVTITEASVVHFENKRCISNKRIFLFSKKSFQPSMGVTNLVLPCERGWKG